MLERVLLDCPLDNQFGRLEFVLEKGDDGLSLVLDDELLDLSFPIILESIERLFEAMSCV